MCGIAGFCGRGELSDLQRMNLAQQHRGPDANGVWCDADRGIYLGHQRLSILDLAGGAQPMWTSDAAIGIVFNGEIYNHSELRSDLEAQGAVFQSHHSDTEVLLQAYRYWGDALVERLNGMWAFVIYDVARQRLFASRDRFGKKPFYYTHTPDVFAFASELTALTAHPAVPRQPSNLALHKFFAYGYIPAPLSWFEGVSKLPGGWNFEFDLKRRSLRTWRYWSFELQPEMARLSQPLEDLQEELLEHLQRAVQRRLISDVPIGVFLSGGVDSSAVAALAARALPAGQLKTFSIGFDDPSFDESAYAERAAHGIGSEHYLRRFAIEDAQRLVPEVLSRLDEPLGDSSLLPTSMLCGFAREHVTVALGGDGADELFAGYDPFRALHWAQRYQRWVPQPVHRAIAACVARLPVSHRNMSLDFKLKRTLRGLDYAPALWCPVWMSALDPRDWRDCFEQPLSPEEVFSEAIALWDHGARQGLSLVDQTLQFYTTLYLQDDILTKVDRASMAHSLEARAPFLDIQLVDFVRRLPWQLKFHRGQTKFLLKLALEKILPHDILYRSKKGFGVPIGRWFQENVLAAPSSVHGVNQGFLRDRTQRHRAGIADERAFLWNATVVGAMSERANHVLA